MSVNKIIDIMRNKYSLRSIKIKAKKSDLYKVDLFCSKFGGYPYIPKNDNCPKGKDMDLVFIAQINCEELPKNNIYPEKGIIQFYVGADEDYGANIANLTDNSNFKVIYHRDIDKTVTLDEIRAKYNIKQDEDLENYEEYKPWYFFLCNNGYKSIFSSPEDCFKLRFEEEKLLPAVTDYRFRTILEDIGICDEDLDDLEYEEICEVLENSSHRIGGYANFAEEDPRNNADYKDYNIMLLQIESQFNNKNSIWEISWGDAGVANFFITKEQLKKQDFSKVLFYWSSL